MVFQKCHSWPPNNRCRWFQGAHLFQITAVTGDLLSAKRRKQASRGTLSLKLDCVYEVCSLSDSTHRSRVLREKETRKWMRSSPPETARLTGTKCVCNPVSIFSSATIHHLPRKAWNVPGLCWKGGKCEWHPCQWGLETGGGEGLYVIPGLGCTVASFKTRLGNQS